MVSHLLRDRRRHHPGPGSHRKGHQRASVVPLLGPPTRPDRQPAFHRHLFCRSQRLRVGDHAGQRDRPGRRPHRTGRSPHALHERQQHPVRSTSSTPTECGAATLGGALVVPDPLVRAGPPGPLLAVSTRRPTRPSPGADRGLLLPRTQLRTPILRRLLPPFLRNQPLPNPHVLGRVDHVFRFRRQDPLDLLLRLLDAVASMGCVENIRATVPGCFRSSDSSFSKMLIAPLGS